MTTKVANIYAALSAAQKNMTRATKDAENPHFRQKYADLASVQDACMPALLEAGFAVFQPLVRDGDGWAVMTILAHESGDRLECSIPLLIGRSDMQGLGSAITYARRYGLLCMSGVAPEDDDGERAVEQMQRDTRGRQDRTTPFDGPPPVTEADIERELAQIAAVETMDQLASYWRAMQQVRPAVARDGRIIEAKDRRKRELMDAGR